MTESWRKLPAGWRWQGLGTLCESVFSGIWGDEPNGKRAGNTLTRVIRVSDVSDAFEINYESAPVRAVKPSEQERFKLRSGDLIVVKSSGSKAKVISGRTALFEQQPEETFIPSNFTLALRPNKAVISPQFLWRFLNSVEARLYVEGIVGTTTYPNLKKEPFLRMPIPLPHLEEQRRIVAKIEALFDRIREAKCLRGDAFNDVNSLLKAALNEVFHGLWRQHKKVGLGKLSTRITKGESPKWQGFAYVEEGPLFIRSENVLWGDLDLSTATSIPKEFHQKLKRSQLRANDVLVNLVGASIGRACVVPDSIGVANVNQAVAVVSPISEALAPSFLMYFVISPIGQEIIHGGKVEAARANISLGDLKGLPVPMPQISDQRRIVAYLDGVAETVRSLRERHEGTDTELKRLEQSILDRAFRGDL